MNKTGSLYAQVVEFEESALGKRIQRVLDAERDAKIERLIELAKLSPDQNVARIAWAIDTDSRILAEIRAIKEEFENQPPSREDETPAPSLYPDYTSPVIAGSREMEFTP